MQCSKSRSGYLEFGQKKQSSFLIRSISGSKFCRGNGLTSQVDKEALVSVDRKSTSLSENRIGKAATMERQIRNLEEELKNTKQRLNASESEKNRAVAELREAKQSESTMLESLMIQTEQITQTKMDLEESKQEVITLHEQLEKLQRSSKNGPNPHQPSTPKRSNADTSRETQALKDEITKLKKELKFATEAEGKSKKAMDDLAAALTEVATESSTATENLRLSEKHVKDLKLEIEKLKNEFQTQKEELGSQIEEYERVRVEYDEALLAWSAKENGFLSCIKKSDEENASLKHENQKLHEALVMAETNSRHSKDEASKLRDILKQALNESNVAKEASNMVRAENSDLKDLLAEKEESVHFLTKENERLRINEVAARENVKEYKRLLAAKAEASKHQHHDDNNKDDVFNSPLSSPQRTFSFDYDDISMYNKKEDDKLNDTEEEFHLAEIDIEEDPEKAEALKGSIFDTTASPKSEPQTPTLKSSTDSGGAGQSGEGDNSHHNHHHHHHHDDDKGYMYSIYNKRKLITKFGNLIIGKTYGTTSDGKKEEQGKEPGKEQGKEQDKDQGKDQGKEPGKEQGKEQGKEPGKEQSKEQGKESGKEPGKEQTG